MSLLSESTHYAGGAPFHRKIAGAKAQYIDMTNTEWLRHRLMASVIDAAVGDKCESRESLLRSEWSTLFARLMHDRLVVGRYRYGRMDRDHDTDYDRVTSILHRMEEYQQHGNMEHLVDIANLCMMEFEHAAHDKAHFEATDDGIHTKRIDR